MRGGALVENKTPHELASVEAEAALEVEQVVMCSDEKELLVALQSYANKVIRITVECPTSRVGVLEQFLDVLKNIAAQISHKIQAKILLHDRFDQLDKSKSFARKMKHFSFGVMTATRGRNQNAPGQANRSGAPSFVALITHKECLLPQGMYHLKMFHSLVIVV